ncbi:MAG: lipase, partial [Planctomycetota bacterium]
MRSLKESDGLRNGPDYDGATIYYPVLGADTPTPDHKFSIMAFCPGFRGSERSMAPWGKFMASHGVVAITLGTNSLSDSPP